MTAADEAAAYDYPLPAELIAQLPLARRDAARMLVVHRDTGVIEHKHVRDLPEYFQAGDLLVSNDTRVRPARLVGRRKQTGGRWEGLVLGTDRTLWKMLAKTRGRVQPGERIVLLDREGRDAEELVMLERAEGGSWLAVLDGETSRAGEGEQVDADRVLERVGRVPLPGYIHGGVEQPGDLERYQTIFAATAGSAAAPTAGLHFTPELLAAWEARGMRQARVTLHVGLDTFRPISSEAIAEHPMHTEWCTCPPATVAAIEAVHAAGRRVLAVGTTSVRTLESAARSGRLAPFSGTTDLYIRPGFSFRVVDCLLTNFHMPRTTLLVLVSTFAGRETILAAYAEAIDQGYRLLSYGDAMLIL
jgi:S-adenosylmethionine:tRNA ribosyltransferase-isomerase